MTLSVPARTAAIAITVAITLALLPAAATADVGVEQLDRLRDVAGLPPVGVDVGLARDAAEHADYTVRSLTVVHEQDPTLPYATTAGAASAARSNVSLLPSGGSPVGRRAMVDQVHVAPFHGLLHLQPALVRSGTGYARRDGWEAIVVDVRGGTDRSLPAARSVIRYPGPGATTSLRSYTGGESPDPLAPCPDFSPPTGAPVLLSFPTPTTVTDVRITDPMGDPLAVCWYDAGRYTDDDDGALAMGRAVLTEHRAVIAMPRRPLVTGAHRVRVGIDGQASLSWSFAVGDVLRGATERVDLPPPPDARLTGVCPLAALPATAFSDVRRDDHAHAVACGAWWSLLSGTSASTYAPSRALTRGQAATLLYRLLDAAGAAPPIPATTHFLDVPLDQTHRRAIDALADDGIVVGRGAEVFAPNESVTRAQLASLLSRALDRHLGEPAPTSTTSTFTDVEVGSSHHRGIEHLSGLGLLSGYGDGGFRPAAQVQRGQMASFLVRTAAMLADDGTMSAPPR